MKKRILAYRRGMDELLAREGPQDWEALKREHLVQVSFFQHERLIHLFVTLFFGLLSLFAMGWLFFLPSIPAGIFTVLVLGLTAAYIHHYFLLEWEVQKMYKQYDALVKKCSD